MKLLVGWVFACAIMFNAMPKFIFLGPSAWNLDVEAGAALIADAWRVLPPVERGGVARLLADDAAAGMIVIVDGRFHEVLAVGHAEIRQALQLGWTVWGLSSMGAIRAFEMRTVGMRGFGSVFRAFCSGVDFRDDEVALLHGPLPPFPPASEPLVHFRAAIEELLLSGYLVETTASSILHAMERMWYGDRTLDWFVSTLERIPSCGPTVAATVIAEFARFRVKTRDLSEFLLERPWLTV